MSWKTRETVETEYFHVYSRGVGGQIVFEDDADRKALLAAFRRAVKDAEVSIIAWCLMDNHFHLLVRGDYDDISRFMMIALSLYARGFNKRYDRKGHLFQSRFGSQPITSEEYLLQAVRYIHRNPEKGHLASTDAYRWSSYREYVGVSVITETHPVLQAFGSVDEFVRFHRIPSDISLIEPGDTRGEAAAKLALQTAIDELSLETLNSIGALPRTERDRCIARLRARGLTVRQIARITGVSKGVIQRT